MIYFLDFLVDVVIFVPFTPFVGISRNLLLTSSCSSICTSTIVVISINTSGRISGSISTSNFNFFKSINKNNTRSNVLEYFYTPILSYCYYLLDDNTFDTYKYIYLKLKKVSKQNNNKNLRERARVSPNFRLDFLS